MSVMNRLSRVGAAAVFAGALAAGAAVPASAASAAVHPVPADGVVSGCSSVCIVVYTETKNYSNHTQYVGQIVVTAPSSWAPTGLLEAWAGNGSGGVAWYRSAYTTSYTWTINQWIKSGAGVCGAYGFPGTSTRAVACITITV